MLKLIRINADVFTVASCSRLSLLVFLDSKATALNASFQSHSPTHNWWNKATVLLKINSIKAAQVTYLKSQTDLWLFWVTTTVIYKSNVLQHCAWRGWVSLQINYTSLLQGTCLFHVISTQTEPVCLSKYIQSKDERGDLCSVPIPRQ